MQSIPMKQQQNLPYYPYGLPNRGPTEVEDDDVHSQVLEYQPEKDEFDSFLTKCFDYTKNTKVVMAMNELRAESPVLDHDAEPQAASQASPLSMKGSSMMLLMMMEDTEPTHLPSSLSEDVETVADDVYLPSLNISSSMEYDGPRTDAESHPRGCAMEDIVEVNVTDEVTDEVINEVAPACASVSIDVIEEEEEETCHAIVLSSASTAEEDDAQLQALSLACKSLDTAMEEYNHFKAFLSMKSPTSASASASASSSSGNPRPRSARTMTHLVCQQAQKRANNTTVLSTAAIEGAKEKEREREAELARKAAKAAARKAAAATPFSPPKPTRASTLRARSVDCYDRPVFASSSSSKGTFGDAAMSPAATKPPMPSSTSSNNKPRLTKRASAAVAAVFRPLHGLFTPEKASSSSSSSAAASPMMMRSRSSSMSRSVSRDTTVVDVHDDGAQGLLLLGAASMDSYDGDATISSPLRERSLSIDARNTHSRRLSSSSASSSSSHVTENSSPVKAVYMSPSCARAMAKQKEVVVKVPLSTSTASTSTTSSAVPKPMMGQKKPSGSNWTGGASSSVMRMVTPATRPSIAMKV